MYRENKKILEQLDRLYSILDLMENDVISSFYKKQIKNDIRDLLIELLEGLK